MHAKKPTDRWVKELAAAKNEGREEGRKAGLEAGREAGREEGLEEGRKAKCEAEREAGRQEGLKEGREAGIREGIREAQAQAAQGRSVSPPPVFRPSMARAAERLMKK